MILQAIVQCWLRWFTLVVMLTHFACLIKTVYLLFLTKVSFTRVVLLCKVCF